jgi:tetratricopeptide (TPR) repeat protein
MNRFLRNPVTIGSLLIAASIATVRAEDASVDQLIKKLPPPEKVAQSAVALDPAVRDPLTKQVVDSVKAMNFGNAYALSQKLASRYPKSAIAQCLHGRFALMLRRYSEATAAYGKAIAVQPNMAIAYLGRGVSKAGQQDFAAAMSDYRQVTRLAPKVDVGWVALSACAEKMGRKRESFDAARQATTVAPSSALAWYQLSRQEGLSGNKQAADKALARANQLRRTTTKVTKR